MFVPYACEIWRKSYGPNYTKFWAFWQKKNKQTNKNGVFTSIFNRVDAILEDVSVAEIILFTAKLSI